MPDSKITALTALTAADPANDMIPIVDVSDTPPASGNTKRISINNILACSPSATLASATITGDLTVDTNVLKVDTTSNNVGINQSNPSVWLVNGLGIGGGSGDAGATIYTGTANTGYLCFADGTVTTDRYRGYLGYLHSVDALTFGTSAVERYRIASDGVSTWSISGSTAMTLNSTGLGVGEAASVSRLQPRGSTSDSSAYVIYAKNSGGSVINFMRNDGRFIVGNGTTDNLIVTETGNVGIGVTPSAWSASYKVLDLAGGGGITSLSNGLYLASNGYENGGWKKKGAGYANLLLNVSGEYRFNTSTAGAGSAGDAITFTQAMTLDASGNLLVGVTTGGTARLDVRTSASQRVINAISTAASDSSTYGVYIAKFANDSTTAQRFVGFTINNDGAGSGQINANGASQAAFGSFSDSRLKENILNLPSQLANILSLRPVEFDYKDGSGHQIGFIAQEMREVYSDTVSEQDGFLTVTGWSKTEARLVSAIKELAAKVQALEAKLA